MKTLIPLMFIALLIIAGCSEKSQMEWTKWRGPHANGTILEEGWSATNLDSAHVIWTKDIGFGHSAVAVRGDKCFASGWKEEIKNEDTLSNSTIYCLDINTGDPVWSYSYTAAKRSYPGPRSTPVLDENRLYSIGWEGKFVCLDAKDGHEIWQIDLAADSLTILDRWGYNPSPVVYEGLILLNLNKSGIAIDKMSGEIVWNSETGRSHYASVQLVDWNGKKAGVFMADTLVKLVDPLTGEIWVSYAKNTEMGMENDVMQTASGDLFTSNELIKADEEGLKQVWQNDSVSSAFRTGVILGDYAYQFSNYKRKFFLYCIDIRTGEPQWREDLGQWGGLSAVNDYLMVLTGLGKVIIVKATPEAYTPVSELQLLSGENKPENWCWTAPTFLDGKLYVRNSKGELACVDLKL